jgi:hypothetical protein
MGMDVYGRENPQAYFHATVWQWRPIHCLICAANARFKLGFTAELLAAIAGNDGAGLESQADCNRLADALARLQHETASTTFSLDSDPQKVEKTIYELIKPLINAGWDIKSQRHYATTSHHLEEFIRFLRECGGFMVW